MIIRVEDKINLIKGLVNVCEKKLSRNFFSKQPEGLDLQKPFEWIITLQRCQSPGPSSPFLKPAPERHRQDWRLTAYDCSDSCSC
jgi:hypothetical protein